MRRSRLNSTAAEPRSYGQCVGSAAWQNYVSTHEGMTGGARLFFSGAKWAAGLGYVAKNGAPGGFGLLFKSLTNPVSNTPTYIDEFGRVIRGSAAVRAALVTSAKAFAVGIAGMEIGIGLGSVATGIGECPP